MTYMGSIQQGTTYKATRLPDSRYKEEKRLPYMILFITILHKRVHRLESSGNQTVGSGTCGFSCLLPSCPPVCWKSLLANRVSHKLPLSNGSHSPCLGSSTLSIGSPLLGFNLSGTPFHKCLSQSADCRSVGDPWDLGKTISPVLYATE